ncbi:hypothetical protein Tco_0768230 [Tanacetum coccineum]
MVGANSNCAQNGLQVVVHLCTYDRVGQGISNVVVLGFSLPLGPFADMGLLDFIKTADPRKVRAVEVQKGDDQLGVVFCAATKRSPAPTERGQGKVLLKRMLIWS